MNNMEKELQRPEKNPKVKIHLDSLRATLKKGTKLENAKPWWHECILL